MRVALQRSYILIALLILYPATVNAALDLHWLWHDRCSECHGHSAEFARKFLSSNNSKLQGRHHTNDLRRFMRNHYLIESEVDAIYDMLLAQVNTPARFKHECRSCHQNAATFARESLRIDAGVLYSRGSGRPIRRFLEHHRGLSKADVEFYMQLLMRVASEVYRP